MNGTETRNIPTSFSLSLSFFFLLLSPPLWISVCLSAQCDLPGHRALQDVPSHGHLETRLRLPGQHQVRALRSLRYPLKPSRNSSPCDALVQKEEMFQHECDGPRFQRPTAECYAGWLSLSCCSPPVSLSLTIAWLNMLNPLWMVLCMQAEQFTLSLPSAFWYFETSLKALKVVNTQPKGLGV